MPKHVARLLALIAGALVLGVAAKTYFTADTFYEYGHYRGASVAEIAARKAVYQTPRYCASCHASRHAQWSANNHKSVSCEVCHGPGQHHPQDRKMPIPRDTVKLCSLCHEAMAGRPRTQPQIAVATHAKGRQCTMCHNPHAPKIAAAVVAGDAAAGRNRAAACTSCHGEAGVSPNDTWPNLAGQHAAYLARILSAYKSGAQKDVMMSPLAQALSDADIQNLASYYGSLQCNAKPSASHTASKAGGEAITRNCAPCHGDRGISGNAAWPHLAAQKETYLVNALKAFRAGLRKDPMMASVTRGLSDSDIAELAAYYARQRCEPQPMESKR